MKYNALMRGTLKDYLDLTLCLCVKHFLYVKQNLNNIIITKEAQKKLQFHKLGVVLHSQFGCLHMSDTLYHT